MTTYWELYVAYVNRCVEHNKRYDIDPHHYEMEWNHWLPKACFPDILVGQWLTLRQHAIASALQTLALGENCMCAWHKKFLPELLLELAWPIYCEAQRKRSKELNEIIHADRDEFGRSVFALKTLGKVHEEKDELGRSAHAMNQIKKVHETFVGEKRSEANRKRARTLGIDKLRSFAKKLNAQVWESTEDGYRNTAGNVAQHNRRNGWDPAARIRIS